MRKLFFLDAVHGVAVLALGAGLITAGCGTAGSGNANANAAAANAAQAAPAAGSGELTAIPTPELTADGLPKFAKGDKYKSVRESLIKAGWKPARSKDGDENCIAGGTYCKEFPELEAGPSSGAANAIFRWERDGKIAKIYTIGEDFSFVNVEVSAKADQNASKPISGTFTYKYTEDYGGRIIFVFDGKGGANFTWEQEDVTWKGKGTVTWSDGEQAYLTSVTVNPEDDKEGEGRPETYVLKPSGKDLILTSVPEGMSAYKGKTFSASK